MVLFHKLSTKIIAAIFLGTILILTALSFFTFRFTKSILEKSIMANQLEIARHTMNKIDRLLNERVLNIQDVAGADPLENILISGELASDEVRKSAFRRLNDYTVVTGPWDVLLLVNLDGMTVLSSDEIHLGKSIKEQPQNKMAFEAVMHEEFYYSDLDISQNTQRLTVIFAAPIRNNQTPSRPIIGAVIGHFSWPAVLQVLEDVPARALLINKQGVLIGQNEGSNEDLFTHSIPEVIREHLKRSHSHSVVLKREESVLSIESLASFAVQSGYLSYEGSGWGLILERPADLAFAPAREAAMNLVVLLIPIILVGVFFMMLMITQWVSKPIAILTRITHKIAEGDLEQRVQIKTKDEMGQLATSFNLMTDRLKKSYDDLEHKVRERTAELSKVNEALQGSEKKARLMIDTANDAFIAMNAKGNIIDWNRRAEAIFGWQREKVIGKPLAESIIPPEYREAHWKGLTKYLKTGEGPVLNNSIKINALHQKGHQFPVELTIWPVRFGDEISFGAFIRDITEQKKLESMLLQSEKMSAVGQLAAGVAHEINNPLGVILGFAQAIVRRIKPEDPFEIPLKSIEREAIRCKNLVQDLLAFSRTGKAGQEPVEIKEAIETSLSLVAAQARVKSVELQKELDEGLPTAHANKGQLQQIIVNLCNNAIDAMPNGGKIIVRTKKTFLHGNAFIELEVEDTGAGIPSEIRSKIFDPFFTTKEVGKGTGLGLSLVYEIVQRHQGHITFDSQLGKGTKFHVLLPPGGSTS